MGLDEALLRAAIESGHATLRFYRWQGAWLSLGYAQRRLPSAAQGAYEAANIGVVRRTTGGRAVLHGADLTYSIAAPASWLQPGLRGSYDQIASALLDAIASLGLDVAQRAGASGGTSAPDFDCFAQPAQDEICVAGRKLIGSAQRRSGGAVLQHGSIRLHADPVKASRAAGLDRGSATSLEELGWCQDESQLCAALVSSFSERLDCSFEKARAEPWELAQAEERVALQRKSVLAAPRLEKTR